MSKIRRLVVALLGLLALAALTLSTACQPQERELSFETIERRDIAGTGGVWGAREPGLMVIATSEDLAQIDNLFTADAQAQLRKVDFDTYFAVVAFLGRQGSGHEGIDIEQVVRRGEDVLVYVRVGNPTGDLMETSPYHSTFAHFFQSILNCPPDMGFVRDIPPIFGAACFVNFQPVHLFKHRTRICGGYNLILPYILWGVKMSER